MVPNVSRGHSFKGLTNYLTHDKRGEPGAEIEGSGTAERVAFVSVLNFDAGEARTPAEAAKVMAMTVRDAERLKAGAGVKATGNKADGPPVWHMSLSWAQGEQINTAEKMQAVETALAAVGLGLERGHQTYCVEHTDTRHPHIHVVVNLVHPVNGKQANPFRDQPKLQAWARDYEKQRGQVHCHEREAKHAKIDKARAATKTRADFNDAAKGGRGRVPSGQAQQTARPRRVPYNVWKAEQARAQAGKAAAGRIREELGGRYHAMRGRHETAYRTRQAEAAQARADRQAGRDAIYAKYATALDAIWKPQSGPKPTPDRTALNLIAQVERARRVVFEDRERGLLGRMKNARALAPRGAGMVKVLCLALNPAERRRLFADMQRLQTRQAIAALGRQPNPPPQPKTPLPKKAQAEAVKAMRAAELAAHAKQQAAAAASMKARHQFQREQEKGQRDTFKAASKTAWDMHRQAFPPMQAAPVRAAPQQDNARQPGPAAAGPSAAKAPDKQQERKADQFGRNRDRQPRDPRPPREGRAGDAGKAASNAAAKAQKRPVDAGKDFAAGQAGRTLDAAQGPELGQGQPVLPKGDPADWTKEERAAAKAARIEELQAERAKEQERGHELDRGRSR